jgi:hypothetical protein
MQEIQAQGTPTGRPQPRGGPALQPMTSFTEFLRTFPLQPLMPLAHGTSFQHFRDIVRTHELTPTPCSVFKGEDLLYLFYGRPAYRVSTGVTGAVQPRHLPVCFVLQPDAITTPKRVYPFDSGAFMGDMFKSFVAGLALNKFELEDFPETTQKLISAFYGNNLNYYRGDMVSPASAPLTNFEVNAYLDLLKDTAAAYRNDPASSDDRRYTIEIQSESTVKLEAEDITDASGKLVVRNRVLAVALPQAALGDKDIRDAVTLTWKAEPITYQTYRFVKPEDYHLVIREKVADFLARKGVL